MKTLPWKGFIWRVVIITAGGGLISFVGREVFVDYQDFATVFGYGFGSLFAVQMIKFDFEDRSAKLPFIVFGFYVGCVNAFFAAVLRYFQSDTVLFTVLILAVAFASICIGLLCLARKILRSRV